MAAPVEVLVAVEIKSKICDEKQVTGSSSPISVSSEVISSSCRRRRSTGASNALAPGKAAVTSSHSQGPRILQQTCMECGTALSQARTERSKQCTILPRF